MWKKAAAAGAVGAAILGAGGIAMAASGPTDSTSASASATPSSTPPSTSPTTATGRRAHHPRLNALRRTVHGTVVTRAKDGTFVTHEVARGTVGAITPTSITVHSADNSDETFVVNSATKVHTHTAGTKGSPASSISTVKTGDNVLVVGKGTPATATGIVELQTATTN